MDLVFPARCPGCERVGAALCDACRGRLRVAPALSAPPGVDQLVAAYDYVDVARELVARVKYRNARGPVRLLGAAMADALRSRGVAAPTNVSWVPTTTERRRARGFDHAALLAKAVASSLGATAVPLLTRAAGPPQTGRRAPERRDGPRFAARSTIVPEELLLVDDVVTTGASLQAAALALRAAGCGEIVAVVAARTP